MSLEHINHEHSRVNHDEENYEKAQKAFDADFSEGQISKDFHDSHTMKV